MKKPTLPVLFYIFSFLTIGAVNAAEHHSGHGGASSSGGGGAGPCMKPHLGKFMPPHLATIAPEAEFSFLAFNIDNPEQITVTVKNMPVAVNVEFKDPYYRVTGKIPAYLNNTAARINIKVSAKSPHCEAGDGWLLKISGK